MSTVGKGGQRRLLTPREQVDRMLRQKRQRTDRPPRTPEAERPRDDERAAGRQERWASEQSVAWWDGRYTAKGKRVPGTGRWQTGTNSPVTVRHAVPSQMRREAAERRGEQRVRELRATRRVRPGDLKGR